MIQIKVFRNPDLISNFLNHWLIATRNVRKFHFGLCLRATVITDRSLNDRSLTDKSLNHRSLTLTRSDAVVDDSDQRKLPNYLLDRLIQRAGKGTGKRK